MRGRDGGKNHKRTVTHQKGGKMKKTIALVFFILLVVNAKVQAGELDGYKWFDGTSRWGEIVVAMSPEAAEHFDFSELQTKVMFGGQQFWLIFVFKKGDKHEGRLNAEFFYTDLKGRMEEVEQIKIDADAEAEGRSPHLPTAEELRNGYEEKIKKKLKTYNYWEGYSEDYRCMAIMALRPWNFVVLTWSKH